MQATKKKMLYIMGVDWEWIYQRPHVIAEYLSRDYDVTVAYPVKLWDSHIAKRSEREPAKIQKLKLWTLPFQRKSKLVGRIADWYKRGLLKNCQRYDYIYISYPIDIEYISADYKGILIYDCIDDYEQMCRDENWQERVRRDEKFLLQRSDIVFVSSQNLWEKKVDLCNNSLNLVRNGTGFQKIFDVKSAVIKERYLLGYIGTIAEWFDYDLIKNNSQKCKALEYHLIGPCIRADQMRDNEIIYDGIVDHERLQSYVKEYDCLIMPFVVNEIVQAVDPVKLYEYIAFGKCIISVYYKELEYFRDYVYFYTSEKEYHELADRLISQGFPPKYNREQQEAFLSENSWEKRYQKIHQLIERLNPKA
ncbi:MAG: hypothetical protein OSJ72_01435 [Lachnospiraceae bacterium]|nr:hypothetical protein [Lachnospiraceae bacterium]